LYGSIELPVQLGPGALRTRWIPVERRPRKLVAAIPGARLQLIEDAGHLDSLDAPAALATSHAWLADQLAFLRRDRRLIAAWPTARGGEVVERAS